MLVVPGCGHCEQAAALLRDAMDAAGLANVQFNIVTVESAEDAAALNFQGSPAFSIDGEDLFPRADSALTCKLYETRCGASSLPTRDDLVAAIRGRMAEMKLAAAQLAHWEQTYNVSPAMYGEQPSDAARYAAEVFHSVGAGSVLELGAGHGRDTLYFARRGFSPYAIDFSATALRQLTDAARAGRLADRITAIRHDVRTRLPIRAESLDAAFAHMLLCMALSTKTIHVVVNEVHRVLRPGGVFVYTVRHTGDAHYRAGISHGDGIYEQGGFAVHYFSRRLIGELARDWCLTDIHELCEGALPRRLFCVTMTRPVQ